MKFYLWLLRLSAMYSKEILLFWNPVNMFGFCYLMCYGIHSTYLLIYDYGRVRGSVRDASNDRT